MTEAGLLQDFNLRFTFDKSHAIKCCIALGKKIILLQSNTNNIESKYFDILI